MKFYTQNNISLVFILFVKSWCVAVEEASVKEAATMSSILMSSTVAPQTTNKPDEITKGLSIVKESVANETTAPEINIFESHNATPGSTNDIPSSTEQQNSETYNFSTQSPYVSYDEETNNDTNHTDNVSGFPISTTSMKSISEINGNPSNPTTTTPMGNEKAVTTGRIQNSENATCDTLHGQYFVKVHPDNTNCSNYYEMCVLNGSNDHPAETLKSCPSEQLFDSIDLTCMSTQFAHCGDYICNPVDGFFPDPKNPKNFIHCFDGVPKRTECEPDGTVFDKDLQICIRLPEILPIGLKFFNAFIWLVNITGPHQNSTLVKPQGYLETVEDYIITTLISLLIPLSYIMTILLLYQMLHSKFRESDNNPFVSDADEFQRYRPASTLPMRSLHPSPVPENGTIRSTGSHYATTRF